MRKLHKAVSVLLCATIAAPGCCIPAAAQDTVTGVTADVVPLKAVYDEPADNTYEGWEQHASPLGNGFIGAMIHGGVASNKIQVNEHSIWSGGPGASSDYDGGAKGDSATIKSTLIEVQQGLQDLVSGFSADPDYAAHIDENGNLITKNYNDYPGYSGLDSKVKSMFGEKTYFGSYQTLGDLYIENVNGDDTYTDYSRTLDIDNSMLTIKYTQNDICYTGEYFISNPYNIMAVRLSADQAGALSKKIRIDSIQPSKKIYAKAADNTITMEGRPSDHTTKGEKFAQQVKVAADGGTISIASNAITVNGADSITIYMSAGTNYQQPTDGSYNFFSTENPLDAVKSRISFAVEKGYDFLKEAHNTDYKRLYDAEKVNFGAKEVPEKTTDALLEGYRAGTNTDDENLYLETLYYQFGRYLLISSSRDGFLDIDGEICRQGSLPANLQGIWARELKNPWDADYHTNINVQMNYWLAQQTNLSECHMPMIDYVNSLVPYGEKITDHYYIQSDGVSPVRGWTVGHECNIWGNAAPGESSASYFPTAAAWICQDIWEYYQFTKDEEFLRENYDTLLKAALFWVDFLWEDQRDGTLVANPSYSPEHGPFSLGAACDQGIIWEIFNEVLTAGKILNLEETGELLEVRNSFDRLSDNLKIGLGGQFMEWKDEITLDITGDNRHRHTNHLFALHPGNQVVAGRSEADDAYINAMKVTLNTRGDDGTGWSKAWKLNFWARLRDGEHSHTMVSQLLKYSTSHNLFDLHPPFQIDGNFGATAGMTEMLLQSQGDSIDLLPALPSAWSTGSAEGIKARGNVEVDMSWVHGYLTKVVLRPVYDGEYKLTGKNLNFGTIVDTEGNVIESKGYDGYISEATGKTEADYIVVDLEGGETYTIYNLDSPDDVETSKTTLSALIEKAEAEQKKHPSSNSFFDPEADAALTAAINNARSVLDESNSFIELLDATEELNKVFEYYTDIYNHSVPKNNWKVSATVNSDNVKNAFDNDSTTTWQTESQKGGEQLLIDLGGVYPINRITLNNSSAPEECPDGYEVYVSTDGKRYESAVATGHGTKGITDIKFGRRNVRYIIISQTEASDASWSVDEIYVFNMAENYADIRQEMFFHNPDPSINEYTYIGTESNHPDGAGYFNLTKYQNNTGAGQFGKETLVYRFLPSVSDNVKEELCDAVDGGKISPNYTSYKINFIGYGNFRNVIYDVKPAITDIKLPAGKYKMYYIAGTNNVNPNLNVDVTFVNDSNGDVTISSGVSQSIATTIYSVIEFDVDVKSEYNGDITFYDSTTWLPDLYGVKLVPADPFLIETYTEDNGDTRFVVTNNTEESVDVQLILASYDTDGRFKNVISGNPMTIAAGESESITENISVPGEYKLFIWDGIGSMIPLRNSYIVQ